MFVDMAPVIYRPALFFKRAKVLSSRRRYFVVTKKASRSNVCGVSQSVSQSVGDKKSLFQSCCADARDGQLITWTPTPRRHLGTLVRIGHPPTSTSERVRERCERAAHRAFRRRRGSYSPARLIAARSCHERRFAREIVRSFARERVAETTPRARARAFTVVIAPSWVESPPPTR